MNWKWGQSENICMPTRAVAKTVPFYYELVHEKQAFKQDAVM